MKFDVEPIGHKPPLPPINLQPVRKPESTACAYPQCGCINRCFAPEKAHAVSKEEGDRIWALVKQYAEGNGGAG